MIGGRGEGRVRVLVVDDSAVVRQALSQVLSFDPLIEVVGVAADAAIAARKIERDRPDVITLDLEMPGMDGLTFLRHLMATNPLPVVICSALTGEGAEATLKALEFGAVDIILKPRVGTRQFIEESAIRICDSVKGAAGARLRPRRPLAPLDVPPKLSADAVLPRKKLPHPPPPGQKVVVVGASTGGTEAVRELLQNLPPDCPPLVIVQHMPESFTGAFARRLDQICPMTVREASGVEMVERGLALIAPGNRHTLLRPTAAGGFSADVVEGPLVCRHRPSVDVLFRSAASFAGPRAVGVILTGMGDDGAVGMLEMREAGAATIAQDEASCVVFGMPKEAIRRGGAGQVLPLEGIPAAILREAG